MAITTAQRGKLSKFIGASRIPAILGKDPWKCPEDVRLEMLGLTEPTKAGPKADIGTAFEGAILTQIMEHTGVLYNSDPEALEFFHPNGVMIAHPDGLAFDKKSIAECKMTSMSEDWGQDLDANGLPARVLLQVVGQFSCIPTAEVAHIGAFLVKGSDWEFRFYTVPRPVELVREVTDAVVEWHARHIVEGRLCEDAPRALESMKRMKRDPEAVVEVESVLLDTLLDATENRKLAEKAEAAAQGELLAAMGTASQALGMEVPASAAVDPLGRRYWLKEESAGMRVNNDRFKSEYPDVYAALAEPATRKMPRWSGLPRKEKK